MIHAAVGDLGSLSITGGSTCIASLAIDRLGDLKTYGNLNQGRVVRVIDAAQLDNSFHLCLHVAQKSYRVV